jgi:hypothetical protein
MASKTRDEPTSRGLGNPSDLEPANAIGLNGLVRCYAMLYFTVLWKSEMTTGNFCRRLRRRPCSIRLKSSKSASGILETKS